MSRILNNLSIVGTVSISGTASLNSLALAGNIVDAAGSTGSVGYFLMASGSNVYWIQNPSPNYKLGGISFYLNGQGTVLQNGIFGGSIATYNGTITSWQINTLYESPSGSITVDLYRSGASIIGAGNKPTLSSTSSASANVSGWTNTTITTGDFLYLGITSSQSLTGAVVTFFINKTVN